MSHYTRRFRLDVRCATRIRFPCDDDPVAPARALGLTVHHQSAAALRAVQGPAADVGHVRDTLLGRR
jgi:hypothetical protein